MLYAYNDAGMQIGSLHTYYCKNDEGYQLALASRLLYITVSDPDLLRAYKILSRPIPEGEIFHIFVGDAAREILFNWHHSK